MCLSLRKLLVECTDDLAKGAQLLGHLSVLAQESAALGRRRFLLGELEDANLQPMAFGVERQRIRAQVGERIVDTLVEFRGRRSRLRLKARLHPGVVH